MSYTFDGENKLIIINDASSFTVTDLYSRWKEWMLDDEHTRYSPALRSIGGDPISSSQNIATYVFLNNEDGWRIRPYEANYELSIIGNLYGEDYTAPLFVPTLGSYTVLITIERSTSAIVVSTSGTGLDQATVQAALSAQGYTTTRALKLDNLDAQVSSIQGGLTTQQATMILEMYKILGLDPLEPLIVSPTYKKVPANGSTINQTMSKVGDVVTVQRV